MKKQQFIRNPATGFVSPLYACAFCEDQVMVAVPDAGVEWDAESCWFPGVGRSIPCPKCSSQRAIDKGESLPFLDYPRYVLEYLACLEAMKKRQKDHDTTRFRGGELRPIIAKLEGHILLRKQPDMAAAMAQVVAHEDDIKNTVTLAPEE